MLYNEEMKKSCMKVTNFLYMFLYIEKSLIAYTDDGNCSNEKNCENYDFVVEESRYTSIWIALGFSGLDWEWNSGSLSQPPTDCGLYSPMDQRGQASPQSHHRLCGGKWINLNFVCHTTKDEKLSNNVCQFITIFQVEFKDW